LAYTFAAESIDVSSTTYT